MRSFNVRDYELFTYMIKCYHLGRMIFEERRIMFLASGGYSLFIKLREKKRNYLGGY